MGKPDLLQKLPDRLQGYKKDISENLMIVVMIDNDRTNCHDLKKCLEDISVSCQIYTKTNKGPNNEYNVINRIICEELESWFLGDAVAIRSAYPRVSMSTLKKYKRNDPDELVSNPTQKIHKILKNGGYYRRIHLPKTVVSKNISEYMNPRKNTSTSFNVFRQGLLDSIP